MARVTVQSIADQLGLSKFAVSRALSGHPGVSATTRAAVVELAERLGYSPRSRPQAKKANIEIIYHDPDVMYRDLWTEVQAGAQIEATQREVSAAVRLTDDPAVISELGRTTDGFMLLGPHDDVILEAARNTGKPCVRVGDPLPPLDVMDYVSGVDEEGASAVAQYLLAEGHRSFVYVHGKLGFPRRIARYRSFLEVIEGQKGVEVREVVLSEDSAPGEFSEALAKLHKDAIRPTGFFCGSDYVAVTVLTELLRMGVHVPEQASVVGYADYIVAQHTSPALTTVRVPFRQMGTVAMRQLLGRIGGVGINSDLPPQRIGLVPKLILRGSSGRAP